MQPTEVSTDVLVIGAGPTGMIAALCLAQYGIRSVVIERREGIQTHPKAHELSARSIEILHGLGFTYEELMAEASPASDAGRILFCGTLREEFGVIDLNAGDGAKKYREHLASPAPYLNLSQVELEKIMQAKLRASPHVDLRYRHQWEAFEQRDGGVTSRVSDLAAGNAITVTSRYVLCADGATSRTRAALGVAMVGPEKIRDFVNAYFQADLSRVVNTRGKIYFIFSPHCPGSVLIAHHVERRWVFHTPVESWERAEDFTADVLTARIRSALGRSDVPIEITSMSSWRMTAQVAERFRAGRAFLLGDAAHRFPPTGGLGMNSGIGDAHNLAWKLARVLRGESPDALLDTYEPERRPVIQTNCDESRRNSERMYEIVEAFGLKVEDIVEVNERLRAGPLAALPASLRAWGQRQLERYGESVLAKFNDDPEVRARVTRSVADQRPHFDRIGLDLGYTYDVGAVLPDGTAPVERDHAVTDYVPSTRPGARLPHFWLDGRRRQRSSHTLIDYRAPTLVLGASLAEDPALTAAAKELGVRLASLGDEAIPLACRGAVHAYAQLAADGALLVRPDGHVAWRQSQGVTPSAALLRSIVREVFG